MSGAPDNLEDGSIDAGLYLLDLVRDPDYKFSARELAEVCGCTQRNISYIEARALAKLRKAFEIRMRYMEPPRPPAYIPSDLLRQIIAYGNYDRQKQREQGL